MVPGQLPLRKIIPLPVGVRIWVKVGVRIRVRGQFSSGEIVLEPPKLSCKILDQDQQLNFVGNLFLKCSQSRFWPVKHTQRDILGQKFCSDTVSPSLLLLSLFHCRFFLSHFPSDSAVIQEKKANYLSILLQLTSQ